MSTGTTKLKLKIPNKIYPYIHSPQKGNVEFMITKKKHEKRKGGQKTLS